MARLPSPWWRGAFELAKSVDSNLEDWDRTMQGKGQGKGMGDEQQPSHRH
jgi:hypothetical protein